MGKYRGKIMLNPGDRFGRLTVVSFNETLSRKYQVTTYDCVCDCGNKTTVYQGTLMNGLTRSCGCLRVDVLRENIKRRRDDERKNRIIRNGNALYKMSEGCNYPPINESEHNAGWDLRVQHDYSIEGPYAVHSMNLGVSVQIPDGTYATLKGRSGIALKGLPVVMEDYNGNFRNGVVRIRIETCTIDCNYRGEIGLTFSVEPYFPTGERVRKLMDDDFVFGREVFSGFKRIYIPDGTKIAQLIVQPYCVVKFEEKDKLDESDRGANGFGSSGIK